MIEFKLFSALFCFVEKLVEQLVSLSLGVEGELSVSDLESKLSKDTVQLVRIALGSLNEPAYTAWVGMMEYAKSRGKIKSY